MTMQTSIPGATTPRELPSRALTPAGWLHEALRRQRDGLTGHPEAMGFPFNTGMWTEAMDVRQREFPAFGADWWPFEQTAYYLDGALRCGYLLEDEALLARARANISTVLAHPKAHGRLGALGVENDQWPMVVFMRLLLEEYANTASPELLAAIKGHYQALYGEDSAPQDMQLTGFDQRAVLHIEALGALYEITGDAEYRAQAEMLYRQYAAANPDDSKIAANMHEETPSEEHAVSYHEFLKLPIILAQLTGDARYLQAAERGFAMLARHHVLADGLSSASEELAGIRSDRVHETCNVSDFLWTCGYMLRATQQTQWADRMEQVLYNAGFGAVTKEFTALQYYSGPNQVILTDTSSHWNNRQAWGAACAQPRMLYRPGHDTECCAGNIHRMLPAFLKRQWFYDAGARAITAALYAPCRAEFPLGADPVRVDMRTDYPFDETITCVFATARPQTLTFRLRIPGWSTGYRLAVNGAVVEEGEGEAAGTFVALTREFADGDTVTLTLEIAPRVQRYARFCAVSYGPLVFSLPVAAAVTRRTDLSNSSAEFPSYELRPSAPWNYALPAGLRPEEITVVRRDVTGYPWDAATTPLALRVPARRVANWRLGDDPYTPDIPETLDLDGTTETLDLVPLGATLLRVTHFPLA